MGGFYVYCHTSPSGKKYVGISINPKKRWGSGRGYKKNYRFWRAINKYGWDNIQHDILASDLTEQEAVEMEKKLVAEWNLTDFEYGYNLREGGDGSLSEYSRSLMSKSRIGNTNAKGKTPSDEVRSRISLSLKKYYSEHPNPMQGRKRAVNPIAKEPKPKKPPRDLFGENNPSAKPVRQLSLDGQVVNEFSYATKAARELNIDLSSIIKCCRGKAKQCGGYCWEYIKVGDLPTSQYNREVGE